MATIRKLSSGRWNAQVRRKGHTPVTKSFIDKNQAVQWSRAIERDMDMGITSQSRMTLEEALIRYRTEITPQKKGRQQEDLRIQRWLQHPLAKRSLSSLQGKDFAIHRDKRCGVVAGNTVRLELAIISHLFTVARIEWDIPVANPLVDIRKPKRSNSRTRRLEDDEEERLLASCKSSSNPLLYPLVVVAIETAMRLSELLNLQWEDVNLLKRMIYLKDTKNGSSRLIPLSSTAMAILSDMPRNITNKRVFYTFRQHAGAIQYVWNVALKKAGIIGLHYHDLRHESVSRLFEKGLNIIEVSSISGHKNLAMLRRYTHIRPENLLSKLG